MEFLDVAEKVLRAAKRPMKSDEIVDTAISRGWLPSAGRSPAAVVNLNGHSDSIGAIFRQIGDAYYGFDAIPWRWLIRSMTPEIIERMITKFISSIARNAVLYV